MRHIPLILLAAALCAAEGEGQPPPGGGDRRPPGPSPEELFHKADADKDGKVTLAELTTALETRIKAEREALFGKMDANGDGQVSKEEFLAFEPPGPPGPPGQEGKDGAEGKKKRRGPDPAELFKRLDRNGDGVITAEETRRPEGREGRPPKGDGDGKAKGKGDDLLAP